MRLLLDECIDSRLAKGLKGHTVRTVPQMGWAGVKNGQLMTLAEKEFDVFITVDRNLSYQQNLSKHEIAVLLLRAKTNRLADLIPLIPKILNNIPKTKPKEVITISA